MITTVAQFSALIFKGGVLLTNCAGLLFLENYATFVHSVRYLFFHLQDILSLSVIFHLPRHKTEQVYFVFNCH